MNYLSACLYEYVGEESSYLSLGKFDPPEHHTEEPPLTRDNSGVLHSEHFDHSDAISEFPFHSAEWDFSFPVLESGDEGGRPGGRRTELEK